MLLSYNHASVARFTESTRLHCKYKEYVDNVTDYGIFFIADLDTDIFFIDILSFIPFNEKVFLFLPDFKNMFCHLGAR